MFRRVLAHPATVLGFIVLGLPGIIDDATAWLAWLPLMWPSEVSWLFLGMGLYWLLWKLGETSPEFKEAWRSARKEDAEIWRWTFRTPEGKVALVRNLILFSPSLITAMVLAGILIYAVLKYGNHILVLMSPEASNGEGPMPP